MVKLQVLLLTLFVLVSCNKRPVRNIAFYENIAGEPTTLNPITSTDGYSTAVHGYVIETLLSRDIDSYEWGPSLATSWEVNEDKTLFTFHLRQDVKWHDGKPFTAEDVKYSFDVIFDDKYNTASKRPYFEGLKEVKILDPYTVQFVAKNQYYGNFDVAAGTLNILPKHYYEQNLSKAIYNKTLIGTGPYKLELYKRGNRIVLIKNKDWWGDKIPDQKEWKFPKIVLRFVSDPNVSLEMLKKGSFDFIAMQPDMYEKKAVGPIWGKSVHKVLTQNNTPKGYNFIGWNLTHPILKDKKVRLALYHLVNRKLMIDKFEYGYSEPAAGPIYPSSPYHDKSIKPIEFNPKKALKLLREAGWRDTDGDNILDKVINGKKTKFSITILEPYEGFMKYQTVFKEDARKAGVDINIKLIEWNSFIKLLEERKFDAVRLAWSANVDWDPKQIWHSSSIKGGSNFIGYNNPEVDRLIDEARLVYERDERIKILSKVENMIVNDVPYVWFTYKEKTMYGHTDRIHKEKDTYQYGVGTSYWNFETKMRKEE